MFGYHEVGTVAHALEDLLDDLRLGRVDLSQEVLDVLFEGVENVQRLLAATRDPEDAAEVDLEAYAQLIEQVTSPKPAPADGIEAFDLDPGVLAVLTEYEEHRLRTNVDQGVPLYRLRVSFSLSSIDTALEELKTHAKPLAEIITYLPTMGGGEGDAIEIDVLLASRAERAQLEEALVGPDAELTAIPRRDKPAGGTRPPHDDEATGGNLSGSLPVPMPGPARAPAPLPGRDVGADLLSLRSVAKTVRVDIQKLDHLMNVVGELAIVRSAVARLTERIRSRPELRQLAIELHRVHRGFERHLEELQDGILDVRMVPLGQVFDKLARVVRQVAREHEKEIRLVVTGADTEVDKLIVEELSDPLMHIIRNAIDHGIELPKVRELAGKSPTGTLVLNAFQKGNHVLIEIEDDGVGMNEEALLDTGVRRGLLTEEGRGDLTRDEILNLIFLPGFSTREAVTDLSGRGVGMDVVKTNIARLGGIVDVQSELGTGTKFTITLPITLAIISALVVEVAGRVFAVPLTAVQEAIMLEPDGIRTVEGREVVSLRGSTLPICRLDRFFGLDAEGRSSKRFVVVSALGSRRLGFVVDGLRGQQDIVIKPLGNSLAEVPGFAGATDLGDQRVALVLDAPALLEEVLAGPDLLLAHGAVS